MGPDAFEWYVKRIGKSITTAENPFNIRHVNRSRRGGCRRGGAARARGGGRRGLSLAEEGPPPRALPKKLRKKACSARQCLTDALGGRTLGRSERRRDPRPAAAAAPCPRWPCATSRSTAPCACATHPPGRRRAPSATVRHHHHRYHRRHHHHGKVVSQLALRLAPLALIRI